MNKAVTEKMREGAELYRQERAAMRQRRLVIGDWMIYRSDPYNLVVQRGEDGEQMFYPDMKSAVTCVFRRMIEPSGKQSLADHARLIERAERQIVEALGKAGVGTLFSAGEVGA